MKPVDFKRFEKNYNYRFPKKLIATKPVSPRDSSRLFVFTKNSNQLITDKFRNLSQYLPPKAVLVFNQTKVIPARFEVVKSSGGRARLLFLKYQNGKIETLSDRKLAIGTTLRVKKLKLKVLGRKNSSYTLALPKKIRSEKKFLDFLEKVGSTPIPPYIKNSPLKESDLKNRYQTVFALRRGSVAAPTASLHFTKRLIKHLREKKIGIKFITLHVNLGTFASLTMQNLYEGKLHKESYEIDIRTAKFLNQAKKDKRPIVAVGTTVLRALESASDANGKLKKLLGNTELFIRPGYRFKFTKSLITNFHFPKSSLLVLVSALVGLKNVKKIYATAIAKKARLFSFGDAMFIR